MPMLTMTYDTEDRLVSATHSVNGTDNYGYDPSNRRVWKQKPPLCQGCPPPEATYFYGVDGTRMGTYAGGSGGPFYGTWDNINVYFAGKLVRREYSNGASAGGAVVDRLGSVVAGALTSRYYPYGEEFSTTQQDRTKFATYYRDETTALDYANQRYYARTIGRFLTADPGPPVLTNPQSWNRYSYAWNDPVNFNDPGGALPASVEYEGGWGCVPGPFYAPGGTVDASSPCPPGHIMVGGGGASKSVMRMAWELFEQFPGVDWDWKGDGSAGINVFAPGGQILFSLSGPGLLRTTYVNWDLVFGVTATTWPTGVVLPWEKLLEALKANPLTALLAMSLVQSGGSGPNRFPKHRCPGLDYNDPTKSPGKGWE